MLNDTADNLLEENNVLDAWRRLFRGNQILRDGIQEIADRVYDPEFELAPERHNILRAFSHLAPERVKVVIVGHEPISDNHLATGLSFSFPSGKLSDSDVGNGRRSAIFSPGKSVPMVHDALCEAGILERGGTYDCCHETWVERGVLLLNASLILINGRPDFILSFTTEILSQVAHLSLEPRVFYVCWGTSANEVGEKLHTRLAPGSCQIIRYNNNEELREGPRDARFVIYIGHHPTYPREGNYIEQATNQFQEIRAFYPGLFDLVNLKGGTAVSRDGVHVPEDGNGDAGADVEATRQQLTEASL